MKSIHQNHSILVGLLMFLTLPDLMQIQAATIYSTTTGGNWNAPSTWEGGLIPGSSDDVVIRSAATVSTILGIYNNCNGLVVQNGAALLNNGTVIATLTVYGDLANYGTIRNGNSFLTIIVYGSMVHEGTEWSNYKIILQGTLGNSVVFGNGKYFSGSYFNVEGVARQITAPADLRFSGTTLDFNGSSLLFTEDDCRLSIHRQSLAEITISGNGNILSMTGGAVIYNSTLMNSLLMDTIRTGSNNLYLENNATLAPGSVLMNFGTSHTVYINGSITNNGTITNGANYLTLNITGNLIQNGIWENNLTYLSGTADQQMTMGSGKYFNGLYLYNSNAGSKSVYAQTNLDFRGTNINFAYGSSGGIRGNLVLPEGGCLRVSGNGSACNMSRINLASAGQEASVETNSGTYIQSFSNSCNRLKMKGKIQVGNNEFYLNNEVQILDTLVNYSVNGHVAYVSGTLRNLGYILNGTGTLELNITGNIIHEGMEWTNYKVLVAGTVARSVFLSPFSVFGCAYFETSGVLDITVPGGLVFYNTKINFFNSLLNFSGNDSLSVHGPDARLINCIVNGDIILNLSGGAYLQSTVFNGNVALNGFMPVYNNGVYFNGTTNNAATLQNQNSTAHTLYINDDFSNTGNVVNGAGMGNFTLELKGNVTNGGVWNNYENKLNGTSGQHIRLDEDQPVNARFILVSNLGGSNYQWYKNGLPMLGSTSASLTLNQVTAAEYGSYQCSSTLGLSRLFTIGTTPEPGFSATPLDGCMPMDVTFSDTSVLWFPIQGWSWDFGDGNGASAQNPAHTYPVEGVYDVSLTIDDGYVSTTATKSGYIRNTRVPMVGFTGQDALFGDTNWFADLTTGIFHDTLTDLQYASEISGFSSQYTEGNWSAQQALGPPDVFPDHEDNILAWASLTANGQREFLCLKYPEAKQVNGVIVYETLYPGAVDSIYLRDLSTMQWVLAWSGTAAPQPLIARAFQVDFPLTEFQTDEVRIAINSPAVPYWNEIDAVALVSPADTLISDETTYEWEMGIGGPVFTTKGDVHYAFPDTGSYNVTLTVTNKGLCTDSKTMVVHIRPPVLVTWTGNMNSSWHERDNWDPPFIPGEEIDVIVPDVYPNSFPIVTGVASCRNIELLHAASLIIGLHAELTVTGDCIIDFE